MPRTSQEAADALYEPGCERSRRHGTGGEQRGSKPHAKKQAGGGQPQLRKAGAVQTKGKGRAWQRTAAMGKVMVAVWRVPLDMRSLTPESLLSLCMARQLR